MSRIRFKVTKDFYYPKTNKRIWEYSYQSDGCNDLSNHCKRDRTSLSICNDYIFHFTNLDFFNEVKQLFKSKEL